MKKIPTLYRRDPENRKRVIQNDVTPGCEWVLDGEGVATRKFDGTCVLHDSSGLWWARREVKPGKTPPDGWYEIDADEVTGKRVGWEPIEQSPFIKPFREAQANLPGSPVTGTYELIGPKINGNPEGEPVHELVPHGWVVLDGTVPYVMGLCQENGWEGIVWHHEDGRMAKLKVKDLPPETDLGDVDSAGGQQ